jgi:small subunit ribosomal protein S16
VVKIRMKMMGRKHRPFFRICAMDSRTARDGRPIEELGTYDPMIAETDKRYVINKERAEYWLSVGAQPSDRVAVLLRKIGIAPRVKAKPKVKKRPSKPKSA